MKIYEVGGAVRDRLLGLPVHDKDYVVVGATEQQMKDLGYRPVGQDFPVFLHPVTHEEYALARTERKTATGYHGFLFHANPSVTLEEDLARRDLTINAMAQDTDGTIIDPFGGQIDLANGCLRHVSDAFVEDPVRILRTARFAARFGFKIHPDTLALMRRMVLSGEVHALVPERIWQELSKGLMEKSPSVLLKALHQCDALATLLPDSLYGCISSKNNGADDSCAMDKNRLLALDYAAQQHMSLPVRFALLLYPFDQLDDTAVALKELPHPNIADRLKAPKACKRLATMSASYCDRVKGLMACDTRDLLEIFEQSGAFHNKHQFDELLAVFRCVLKSMPNKNPDDNADDKPITFLQALLSAAKTVDTAYLAKTCQDTPNLIKIIAKKRIEAMNEARKTFK